MSQVQTVIVAGDEAELRLDRWFRRRFPHLGHARLEKLLRTGQIRVDGRRAKASLRLAPGQAVRVPPLGEPDARPRAVRQVGAAPGSDDVRTLQAAVLYRDEWVLALDKPAGLAVQGGTRQSRHLDAMLDALRFGAAERPRLVHRLDKDTSGVLLLARSAPAARRLAESFRHGAARKLYWALVVGRPPARRGVIDLPLAKQSGRTGEAVAGAPEGRAALTLYQVVECVQPASGPVPLTWLLLMPRTGRTHQLRAHCAALGTPILGDGKYGGKAAFPERPRLPDGSALAKRLLLHAREIAVPHPDDGTTLRVVAPAPAAMKRALAALGLAESRAESASDALLGYAENPPGAAAAARAGGRPRARQTMRR